MNFPDVRTPEGLTAALPILCKLMKTLDKKAADTVKRLLDDTTKKLKTKWKVRLVSYKSAFQTGNNLTGVAVQFATQDQKNTTQVQKCIAIFNIKICCYVVLFIPISSKVEFFAMQIF